MTLAAAIIPVTPFQQNCALIWDQDTKRGVVIDPGGDVARIEGAIAEAGITIDRILLTHGHMDHAGGAAELAEVLGNIPIEGPHRADAFLLEGLVEQGAKYGLQCRAVTPNRWLEEGETVQIAGIAFDVLHCPGHTPGHVVFVNAEMGIAIVGDVLFQGSIGRTDFPRGDHATLIQSITERLWPWGNDVTFVPGHGPTSTFGRERQTNPFVGDHALR